jgi:lambda repressor-like predicted transcriptional regulator
MKAKDLINLNNEVRQMIVQHLERTGQTLNNFSKEAGVHQNQLWMYLYSGEEKKGLHSYTIEKIGRYLAKK